MKSYIYFNIKFNPTILILKQIISINVHIRVLQIIPPTRDFMFKTEILHKDK